MKAYHSTGPLRLVTAMWPVLLLFTSHLRAAEEASGSPLPDIANSAATWLPLSQDDKLNSSIRKLNQHALEREGCARIVVSKLADQFDAENPKFIVTCEHDRGGTFNLVYFQSDVDNGFREIKQTARAAVSPRELAALQEECREALLRKYGAGIPDLDNTTSSIDRRGEGHYALFFDYTEGAGELALDFTITCVKFPERMMQTAIFPR